MKMAKNRWFFLVLIIILFMQCACAVDPPKDSAAESLLSRSKKRQWPHSRQLENPKDFYEKFKPFLDDAKLEELGIFAHKWIQSKSPLKVGYGFMMGYSSGYCIRRVSKLVAFLLGSVFVTVQTLSYNGYLAVNYEKVQHDIEKTFDLDNDGIFSSDDLLLLYEKVKQVVSYNMPTGGGFMTGMLVGLRA